MKRALMILALAFTALPILADKKTPVPSVSSSNLNSSRSNTFRAATVVSQSGNIFTVMANGKQVTFSAAKLKELPKVGETIDITYTQPPGGPMEATTVKSSKSNSSEREAADKGAAVDKQQDTQERLTGRVLSQQGKTFTVMSNGKKVTFSGAMLKDLPKVGEIIDITYIQTPGGPMEATTVKSSKSNSSD
jgi:hypothetical protein